MPWSRRTFLASAAAGALVGRRAHARRAQPNILLLFPDQLRASALSCYGEQNIETRVFDRLLGESVHFSSAYSPDPVCAPARAGLLTGRMPHATGVFRNGNPLPQDLPTIASVLGRTGYETGYIGKWHLHATREHPGYVPRRHRGGFDWFAGYNVAHRYRRAIYYVNGKRPVRPEPPDRFEPEFQVDLALDFIEEARGPWFLMVAFGPPHPPGTAPIDDWSIDLPRGALDRVDPAAIRLAPNVPGWIDGPNRGLDGKGPEDRGVRHHLQGYYAAILALEASIQRLLRGLDALGHDEDTLVVLTSDHGEMGGGHGLYQKGEPYEESVRVPLAFRWKGSLAPRPVDALASTIDVAPTLLGVAGAAPVDGMHGLDLGAWLEGSEGPRRDHLLIQGNLGREESWRMVRSPRWTYAEWLRTGRRVLWDMDTDAHQLRDLSADPGAAGIREELAAALKAQRRAVGDTGRDRGRRPDKPGSRGEG